MSHGKLLSTHYLFDSPIQQACRTVGLVRPGGGDGTGRGTVTAHRFRHTVGTLLAERGAKLHTIMKILGHTSVNMALVYTQISDQQVLLDYGVWGRTEQNLALSDGQSSISSASIAAWRSAAEGRL